MVLQKQSEQLTSSFEAPLKEFVRAVKSAKSVMTDRSTALGLLQQVCQPRCKLTYIRSDVAGPELIAMEMVYEASMRHQHEVCQYVLPD